MESQTESSCVALDDIDIIREIFKTCPEYGEFILAKAKRATNLMNEVIEDISDNGNS